MTNEQIRRIQALELRDRVENMANYLVKSGWKDVSVLILGDFNAEPSDSSVQSILRRNKRNDVVDENIDARWEFQSAYPLEMQKNIMDIIPENNLFTTWKTRRDGTVRQIIDYIFYANRQTTIQESAGLHCTHVLSVPEKAEVEESLFPGFRYPSDHLLIAAKFHF